MAPVKFKKYNPESCWTGGEIIIDRELIAGIKQGDYEPCHVVGTGGDYWEATLVLTSGARVKTGSSMKEATELLWPKEEEKTP